MEATYGRYIDTDLSSGNTGYYEILASWQERYLGGKGIAARVLLEELRGGEHPFSPENILVFATGPFQGTGLVGAGRHVVMSISPKTQSVADSYAGGYFGHELGRSGYDGILVRGASPDPVILVLVDGKAEIRPANELWGKGTGEVQYMLAKRYPGARIAAIGIAGEKLVNMSCIIHDRSRSAGRPGLGAVMGAKKLKAIVVRGNQDKILYNSERFETLRSEYVKLFLNNDMKSFGAYGTARFVEGFNELGILPTKNFQEGIFGGATAISGEALHDTILVGRETCAGCPVRCKRSVRTSFAGRDVLPEFGGPEYETIGAFGSLCLNHNLDVIALANQLCNDYGLDTISAGVAIAFLMEASEKGLVEEKIPWGDGESIISLIDSMAHREGVGDRIANGLESFAKDLGADFCMTIKGVEVPMHEPRGKKGLGISYATSPRGATHMEGIHDTWLEIDAPTAELGIDHAFDRFSLADKPPIVRIYENLQSFENSLILCAFTARPTGSGYKYPEIRHLLEAATGHAISKEHMLRIGERNYLLLKLHAARCGYTVAEDQLPSRFHTPLPAGNSANHPIDREAFRAALRAYGSERGYDRFGPTEETLRRLGMDDCIGVLVR